MEEQKNFSVLAVIVGWLISVIISYLGSRGMSILIQRFYANPSFSLDLIAQNAVVITVIFGLIAVLYHLLGGYIAGALAPKNEVQHAVWVGILILLTNVFWITLTVIRSPSQMPSIALINPFMIAMTLLIIPSAMLGGFLASGKSRNRHMDHY